MIGWITVGYHFVNRWLVECELSSQAWACYSGKKHCQISLPYLCSLKTADSSGINHELRQRPLQNLDFDHWLQKQCLQEKIHYVLMQTQQMKKRKGSDVFKETMVNYDVKSWHVWLWFCLGVPKKQWGLPVSSERLYRRTSVWCQQLIIWPAHAINKFTPQNVHWIAWLHYWNHNSFVGHTRG